MPASRALDPVLRLMGCQRKLFDNNVGVSGVAPGRGWHNGLTNLETIAHGGIHTSSVWRLAWRREIYFINTKADRSSTIRAFECRCSVIIFGVRYSSSSSNYSMLLVLTVARQRARWKTILPNLISIRSRCHSMVCAIRRTLMARTRQRNRLAPASNAATQNGPSERHGNGTLRMLPMAGLSPRGLRPWMRRRFTAQSRSLPMLAAVSPCHRQERRDISGSCGAISLSRKP